MMYDNRVTIVKADIHKTTPKEDHRVEECNPTEEHHVMIKEVTELVNC